MRRWLGSYRGLVMVVGFLGGAVRCGGTVDAGNPDAGTIPEDAAPPPRDAAADLGMDVTMPAPLHLPWTKRFGNDLTDMVHGAAVSDTHEVAFVTTFFSTLSY